MNGATSNANLPRHVNKLLLDSSHKPRVSVIIPVRNGKDYIQEALDSVFLQDFTDFEVIVIDDGSDDFDYRQLELQDARVRVITLEGRGVSHARNVGIKFARGDYFAFLDADDVWFPGKLKAQMRYFDAHSQVGVVFGQFIRWLPDPTTGKFNPPVHLISECGHLLQAEEERSGWIYTRLLMGLLVGMNTAVVRRNVIEQVNSFNESMRIGEDYDFWLRASRICEMHALAGPVALYRIHRASAMHRISDVNYTARVLLCAFERWGIHNPDSTQLTAKVFRTRVASTYFAHGYAHFWNGDLSIARRSFAQALIGGGHRFHALVYYILSFGFGCAPALRRLKRGN